MLHRAEPPAAVETTPAPAPPPALPGRTLAVATTPFRAFAMTGGGTVGGTRRFFVLDQGQRLASFAADGAPLDTWNLESSEPGLLVGRDEGLLWLDGERVLRSIGGAAEAPAIVPLRGSRQWQRPVAAATYAGNLYVLDAGSGDGPGQIWRHAGTPGGFDSDPQPWLQASSGANVSGARGFAIDGSIWVARGESGIVRLTAGRPDPLQLAGVDPPLASAGAIYTEFGYRSVYVADATTRRVLQFSKVGRFEQQVTDVFPIGEAPLGLWVDEPSGRCLILTTGRLQEVQLPR
jgi:hypothetical protein